MAKSSTVKAPDPIPTNAQNPLTQTSTPASINSFVPAPGGPSALGQALINAQPSGVVPVAQNAAANNQFAGQAAQNFNTTSGPMQVSAPAAPAPASSKPEFWTNGIAPDGFNYGAILAAGKPAGYINGPIITDKNTPMTPELKATLDYNKALRYQNSANNRAEAAAKYGTDDLYMLPSGWIPRDLSLIKDPGPDPNGFVVGGGAVGGSRSGLPPAFQRENPALKAMQNSVWGNAITGQNRKYDQYQKLASALAGVSAPANSVPQSAVPSSVGQMDFSGLTPQQRSAALQEYVKRLQPVRSTQVRYDRENNNDLV